jgi:hypothetical protein
MLPLTIYAPVLLPGLDSPWAERYIYLSSVGFVIGLGLSLAVWTYGHIPPNRNSSSRGELVVFSIAVRHSDVWMNDLTLWTDAVKKSPKAWAAALPRICAVHERNIDGAIGRYRTAISMKPDFADAHLNLGVAGITDNMRRQWPQQRQSGFHHAGRDCANLSVSLAALGYMTCPERAEKAIELDPLCGPAALAGGSGI